MKIAAVQYPIEFLGEWRDYQDKVVALVENAVAKQAQLLVFPEYGAMELASLFGKEICSDLQAQIAHMQALLPGFVELYHELARRHDVYILAPSFPVRVENEYRNRAYFFGPSGGYDFQEKLVMTRFESEKWIITPGNEIKVFETRHGKIGVNVCYDVEFPLIARQQAAAGANLILVPSCTDTLAGYHRVRVGAQARAMENQCFVAQSPTIGEAPWSEAVDVNVGAAGVYTPIDRGFPSDGVLARGEINRAQWVYADVDFAGIAAVRDQGQVFNYRDWEQQTRIAPAVQIKSM
jgi:predicted amidohydrolase